MQLKVGIPDRKLVDRTGRQHSPWAPDLGEEHNTIHRQRSILTKDLRIGASTAPSSMGREVQTSSTGGALKERATMHVGLQCVTGAGHGDSQSKAGPKGSVKSQCPTLAGSNPNKTACPPQAGQHSLAPATKPGRHAIREL